jgi:indole-3-glycerol phosphate synthase
VADKKAYLEKQKLERSQADIEKAVAALGRSAGPDFFEALKSEHDRPKILAEAKKASPSAGVLREPFSPEEINDAYQAADNVVAISVITERDHFQGSEDTLAYFAEHNTNGKPLLRKDFLFDPYQILESKLLGAHAYLLIVSLFDQDELAGLIKLGRSVGLEPLVEVHDQSELDIALKAEARCIGANCRDLKTFKIDHGVHELLKQLDDSYARVAESAIDGPEYLRQVTGFSDAALIGTRFMRAPDIPAAIEAISAPEAVS